MLGRRRVWRGGGGVHNNGWWDGQVDGTGNEEGGEDSTVGSPTNVLGEGGFEPTNCHPVAWWVAARPFSQRREGMAWGVGMGGGG